MSAREHRMASLRIMDEYYWMMLRQLELSVSKRLGEAGLRGLGEGLRLYGRYRGESLRQNARTCAEGRDAMSLVRAWDVADLMLAQSDGRLEVEGDASCATVRLALVPGSDYLTTPEGGALLAGYWRETLAGLAAGYDEALSVSYPDFPADPDSPWAIIFSYAGDTLDRSSAPPGDALADAVESIDFSRRTVGVMGALGMYVARALGERFGGSAEAAVREALYNFGFERAQGMREQALAEGRPLDFLTWTDIIQQRDPHATSFVYGTDSIVTRGVFQVACTYCPCAEVWAEEGARGLDFGYLYDVEVHRALVEGFNPRGVAGWEKVKTRGDRVCNFRFFIPELVTDDDPAWARDALK